MKQYATLGSACLPKIIACTSNEKFILPSNPVYFKQGTEMLNYPSNLGVYDDAVSGVDNSNKDQMNSYFGKSSSPIDPPQNISLGGCKTCGGM
jgi:hypothetical protein